MTRRRPHRRRGFTLVEALATIVVLTALGSVGATVLYESTDGFVEASTRAQLHTELSLAMDRAVREIRKIDRDPAATGVAPDINGVTATEIRWHTPETKLWRSGSFWYLNLDGGAANVLLRDVTAFTLETYDESNALLGTVLTGTGCDPIRRVLLEVTITRNGVSETLRSKVFVRSTLSGSG
ncbi:MAG: hypothetical protein HKO59_07605 [Phycisphaerales bacterium]|nr:type II secretion system GspH family protein [Phycisphaerae bacterium]NNF43335.1 hypothetical protein [Phycisphaerales bacterium]NNM25841.1 hypothetical protein [Phycisphaerales bacterium]